MPIIRVKSIEATAEIAGLVRDVGYDSETKKLWVQALDSDEALELLRLMGRSSKKLTLGTSKAETEMINGLSDGKSVDSSDSVDEAKSTQQVAKSTKKPVPGQDAKSKTEPLIKPAKKRKRKKKAEPVDQDMSPEKTQDKP